MLKRLFPEQPQERLPSRIKKQESRNKRSSFMYCCEITAQKYAFLLFFLLHSETKRQEACEQDELSHHIHCSFLSFAYFETRNVTILSNIPTI